MKEKKTRKLPNNFAPMNSPFGGDTSFLPREYKAPSDNSSVIRYKMAFVKVYNNVTSKDLGLQRKYSMNLISDYLNIKPEFLRMKQHKKHEDILHTDRVYYIYKGKKLLGKCSIREQRTFTKTNLVIIFRYRTRASGKKVHRERKEQRKEED